MKRQLTQFYPTNNERRENKKFKSTNHFFEKPNSNHSTVVLKINMRIPIMVKHFHSLFYPIPIPFP